MRKFTPLLILVVLLLSSMSLFAQDSDVSDVAAGLAGLGFAGVMIFVWFLIALIPYLFFAFGLMKIAKKLNVDNGWFAFIPFLNIVLMLQCADKPVWWIVFVFIPGINVIASFVISILAWMVIAEKLGKESWWGIVICLVPLVNLILFGILAFGNSQPVGGNISNA